MLSSDVPGVGDATKSLGECVDLGRQLLLRGMIKAQSKRLDEVGNRRFHMSTHT